MDGFLMGLNGVCLAAQGVLHLWFVCRLTGKRQRLWPYAVYLALLFLLDGMAVKYALPWLLAMGGELLLLWGIAYFALGNRPSVAWIAALLAVYSAQLSFGMVNAVESILFPYVVGKSLLYLLMLLATLLALGLCAGCYSLLLRFVSLDEAEQRAHIALLLVPALFCFAAELYIMETAYTQYDWHAFSMAQALAEAGKQTALLVLQGLGLGALFCTLYAYRRIRRSFQTQAELQSMTQAVQAQKVYITEAQMREEQTRAFRHDLANHLSVLEGLLRQRRVEEAKTYLQTMKTASGALSFPYQTGNPVVDVLLGGKLGLAQGEGVTVEVSLRLPVSWEIDDFDLCVIFANALDNALRACQAIQGERYIRLHGEQQGTFYRLSFENSCAEGPLPPAGTGLSNIRSAAEKYHGAMLAEKTGTQFALNVLLNIS